MIRPNKITVFGAGIWGSVLAEHLANKGNNVCLWEYFEHLIHEIENKDRLHPHIPHFHLDKRIQLTHSLEEASDGADFFIMAISSKSVRYFARTFARHLKAENAPFVSATKGLEESTLKTMCEVAEEELPALKNSALALSGPSFALEVLKGVPTKIKLAGLSKTALERARDVIEGFPIKLELSSDRRGVEVAGASKNVLAIGCGIIDGMRLGANTKAALLTEGIKEIRLLVTAAGGQESTAYGLAGLGDIILTGTSEISRNRKLGEKLGQGKAVFQARGEINTVAEGIDSLESVFKIIQEHSLSAPVITAIYKIAQEGGRPDILLHALGF